MNEVFQRFRQLDAAAAALYDPFERVPGCYFRAFRRCLQPREERHRDETVAEYLDGGTTTAFHNPVSLPYLILIQASLLQRAAARRRVALVFR